MKYFRESVKDVKKQLKMNYIGHPVLCSVGLAFVVMVAIVVNVYLLGGYSKDDTLRGFWLVWVFVNVVSQLSNYSYSKYYRMLPFSEEEIKCRLVNSFIIRFVLTGGIMAVLVLPGAIYGKSIFAVPIIFILGVLSSLYGSSSIDNNGQVSIIDKNGNRKDLFNIWVKVFIIISIMMLLVLYSKIELFYIRAIVLGIVYAGVIICIVNMRNRIKNTPLERICIIKGEER